MATYQRPGVYVEETLTALPVELPPTSATVAAFIGGADRGPDTPTLVTSWSQYIAKYGGWNTVANNDLPFAVYSFFRNGGSSAYIQRVIGDGSEVAVTTLLDASDADALDITAATNGEWGNQISVAVSNVVNLDPSGSDWVYDLTVYYGGVASGYIVERYSQVSSDPASLQFVDSRTANSAYISVTSYPTTHPKASSGPVTLSGGLNGADVTESDIADAVVNFDTVTSSLLLNACGVTSTDYVDQLTSYAANRGDVFVIIDSSGATSGDQLTAASNYLPTSYAAVYYPPITVPDPTKSAKNATKTISPAGAVMGLYVLTDASRGVFKAPAGLTSRLANVVSVAPLTNAELDSMNSSLSAVNAIRYIPGSGVVVMGARTLKATYVDKYVPVRRTLIYLRKSLTDITQFAVFEPNDSLLWATIRDTCTKHLTQFWKQGGLRGASVTDAFFVKCDSENNPISSVDEGIVNIEVGVALQRPAEFVIIKIGQFEGGTSVTVA